MSLPSLRSAIHGLKMFNQVQLSTPGCRELPTSGPSAASGMAFKPHLEICQDQNAGKQCIPSRF